MPERYELNPKVISLEAVQAVVGDLVGEPITYVQTLRAKRLGGTHFEEIIHPEFQVFRIGMLGFELPVAPGDKDKYGIKVDVICSLGREDIQVSEQEDIGWDSIESINTMRAFVASAFFEEATRQKLSTPQINDRLIDPPPAKKYQIESATAPRSGFFLYDWEEFAGRWAEENPELHQATVQLRDGLTDYYANRMVAVYRDLPQEYMDRVAPEVRETYSNYLMEYAIRTYAMLTPNPPALIEVKRIKSA